MFLTLLRSAIRLSAVYLYGCVGETITEKSGNLNLGTPAMCRSSARIIYNRLAPQSL